MPEHGPARPTVAVEDLDFEAVYQGGRPIPDLEFRFETVPWDIGRPQPAVVALADAGALGGEILDVGCGLGENAVFLAGRGHHVTAVDSAPTALGRARERARERGVDVTFVQADATTLEGLDRRFTTVLDSALYHCLGEAERSAYAAALHRVTMPGAQLHLFCFADTESTGFRLPNQFGQDDLRTRLGEHWDIHSIEPAVYSTSVTREQAAGFSQVGMEVDVDALRTDDEGRMLLGVWHLHATRR